MDTLGIYIHVPFCAKKCPYCDFYSVSYNKKSVLEHTDAVIRNIKAYSRNLTVDTVYFGGGTPSLLPSECIESIVNAVGENFVLGKDTEITLEVNPNTVNRQKLQELWSIGVNRLSVGVQSLISSELKLLGRTHSAERAIETVMTAHETGFENISCDMIIGLPKQTIESIEYTISRLSELPITHISSYILKVEENTPFNTDDFINSLPDEDVTSDMYLFMVQELEKNGFMQYEVSNFAKSGFQSRHNNKYWNCFDYLGIGASAHSCFEGKRFAVPSDIGEFIVSPIQKTVVTDENPCQFKEYAMLKLRLKEGILLSECENPSSISSKIPQLVKSGYVNFDGERISLTANGFLMSNSVIEYLIF